MTVTDTLIYEKKILIFGCGNILFGNDGFGPEVIHFLDKQYTLPDNILALDAGTGIRDFMFDLLLMEKKPEHVLIIDAVTMTGRKHGDVFEVDLSDVPREKMSDFSLHQSPCTNFLSQLKDQGVDVIVLGMNTASIPNKINPGLDPEAQKAIPIAASWILKKIKGFKNRQGE